MGIRRKRSVQRVGEVEEYWVGKTNKNRGDFVAALAS